MLNPEVGKGLIGFCHTMGIFFFLICTTFTFAGGNDLIRQFLCHTATVPITAVADQPFHTQRYLSIGTHLSRDLESSTTNSAAAYFNGGCYIAQCLFPYIVAVLAGSFGYTLKRSIEYIES